MAQQNNKTNALSNYVEVNVRIEKFWEKHPNGRIETNIVSWENGVIVMRANVYKDITDDRPTAVGHAYEKEGSSFINKTSALENCETSAVGRALAIMGFEIKKSIASREEVANAQLNRQQPELDLITANQLGEIKTKALQVAELYNLDLADVYQKMKITNLEELSRIQAEGHIATLNKSLQAKK